MPIIDSDAHVLETPQTWSYMRDDEQDFRPQVFVRDPNDGPPFRQGQRHQYWVIEGKLQSKGSNVGNDVPSEAATLADVQRRLNHMERTERVGRQNPQCKSDRALCFDLMGPDKGAWLNRDVSSSSERAFRIRRAEC